MGKLIEVDFLNKKIINETIFSDDEDWKAHTISEEDFAQIMTETEICDVCGRHLPVTVHASSMGPLTLAYCAECDDKHLEPYDIMVAYIAAAGSFPEDINRPYQSHCRHILREMGISEEQFIKDVRNCRDQFDPFL